MNKELLVKSFINTTLAVIYIFVVSQIMDNGDKIFGKADNKLAPFVFLMLFTLSAATVGGLILGRSAVLFLNKKNKEATMSAVYSIGWLGAYTVLGLVILMALK